MTSIESSQQKFPRGITIIGTGRLGTTLALRLHQKGYRIHSLFNRTLFSCEALAGQTQTEIWGSLPESLSDLGDLVFLALPDDEIAGFAKEMANRFQGENVPAWIHTSGATPAEVLQPLSRLGAQTASFHPVQTFNAQNREKAFDQCFVTLQGEEQLCKDLKQVVRVIGGRPLIVDKKQKVAIHLAAVFLCNYYVALFSGAQEILDASGIDIRARELFGPIVGQTIEALLHNPPEGVLTGPIVRGDVHSIESHLEQLQSLPEWEQLYRQLGKVTLDVARKIPRRDTSADQQLELIFRT